MIKTVPYVDALQNPIVVLEEIFRSSGMSLIQAAFRYSFFLDPEKVNAMPVKYPEYARYSRKYYPGKKKDDDAYWNGRRIRIDGNARAQRAWERYSGRAIVRATGYGVRHIWGNPWDPGAFTAGWNLCYMPFWVGMLTEDQHPLPELKRAIQQASYDLYFKRNPVCSPPDFVTEPGVDLKKILGEQPVLILCKAEPGSPSGTDPAAAHTSPDLIVLDIRSQTHASWSNLLKAIQVLRGQQGVEFGTRNVEATSKAAVRRICRETDWDLVELKRFIEGRVA